MSDGNSTGLVCGHCGISAVKLNKVYRKMVCRPCKRDFIKNGKFTRNIIQKRYHEAENFAKEKQKQYNKTRYEHVRKNRLHEGRKL